MKLNLLKIWQNQIFRNQEEFWRENSKFYKNFDLETILKTSQYPKRIQF